MKRSRRQERPRAGEGDETIKETEKTQETPRRQSRKSRHRTDPFYTQGVCGKPHIKHTANIQRLSDSPWCQNLKGQLGTEDGIIRRKGKHLEFLLCNGFIGAAYWRSNHHLVMVRTGECMTFLTNIDLGP